MKTKNLILSFLVVTFLWSCSEDSEMTVILKESGELKIELLQNGTPITETMVYLLPQMSMKIRKVDLTNIEYAIDMKKTDEDGMVDFGEVNAGNYVIVTGGVVIGSLVYLPERTVQVISDAKKTYTIDVLDYVGSISITVNTYNIGTSVWEPASGYKVAIVLEEDTYLSLPVEDLIDLAIDEKITGVSGIVTFDLPSGYWYSAIVYTTFEDATTYNLTYLETGEEYSEVINFGDYK